MSMVDDMIDDLAREVLGTDARPLAEHVRRLCIKHGGVRKCAKAVGISYGYLARMRNGKARAPSDATLRKLGLLATPLYLTAEP